MLRICWREISRGWPTTPLKKKYSDGNSDTDCEDDSKRLLSYQASQKRNSILSGFDDDPSETDDDNTRDVPRKLQKCSQVTWPMARLKNKFSDGNSDTDCEDDPKRSLSSRASRKRRFPILAGSDDESSETDNSNVRGVPHKLQKSSPAPSPMTPLKNKYGSTKVIQIDGNSDPKRSLFSRALNAVLSLENVTAEEATTALHAIGPPYGLQEATRELREMRQKANERGQSLITIHPGMKLRKRFNGKECFGEVVSEMEDFVWKPQDNATGKNGIYAKVWRVKFDDGEEEDLEWDEIVQCRCERTRIPASCRGRPLQCLELFCGQGIVAQEFSERKWKTASIDILQESNATIKVNILDLKESELPFVPDFIWASPPCKTYSCLAGSFHRSTSTGELDKSNEAREHNFFFQKMAQIMKWAKSKHPHLIVVIENPVGYLKVMPLMQEFTDSFGLHSTKVDYCAFGRDEMKPTMIWTNDWGLKSTLSEFTCTNYCAVGKGKHTMGVRGNGHLYDFSVIPQPLAEEVAAHVDAKFYFDRIRTSKAALPDD